MKAVRFFLVLSIVLFLAAFSPAIAGADTFIVTNPDDSGDYSLRWAIEQANLNPGEDTILFDSSYTIYPMSELPALSDTSGGTTIDGENFEVIIDGSDASLLEYGLKTTSDHNNIRNLHIKSIPRIAGSDEIGGYGIRINSSYNTIYACKIYMNDYSGIHLGGVGSDYKLAEYNKIQACYIGSSDGVTPGQGNSIKYAALGGIYGRLGANHTIIGVDGDGINDENEGNVISGNGYPGGIWNSEGKGTRIAGNMIGVDKTGTVALPNTGVAGVVVGANAIIGTDGDGVSDELERNIISGNRNIVHGGVRLEGSNSRVSGNYVGVDITGTYAIPNEGFGISFRNGSDILIGTDADGISDDLERNIVSGNTNYGVGTSWSSSIMLDNVRISGNYIGTDVTGTAAIGNAIGIIINPISISSSTDCFIGTNGDGVNDELERNIISGNGTGIFIKSESRSGGIQISNNYIGTDVTGTNALPNKIGIKLNNNTSDNIIGTNGDGIADDIEGNVIVATGFGISFANNGSSTPFNNRVSGNYIGTDKTGNVRLDTSANAMYITNAHNNIFGTNGDGISDSLEGNIITGGQYGINMSASENNRISGNNFGLGVDGISQLGLGSGGIYLGQSHNTIIGTDGDGISDSLESNVFIANGTSGNAIQSHVSDNCRISGNYIGTDKSGTLNSGFGGSGILIQYGNSNLIGTDWDGISDIIERNTIVNNGYSPRAWWYENDGITIKDGVLHGSVENRGKYNAVQGNTIYGNKGLGIDLLLTANENIMAPVMDSAIFTGSGLLISGTAPVGSNVEVFVADADPSGAGEGKMYKGRTEAVDGSFSLTITNVNADDLITATSTDSSGNTSEFAVNMSITGNSPPELYPIGDKEVDEGQWLTFYVTASDPNRDFVTITATDLPSGATFNGGTFDWIPDYNQAGVYAVTFIASDGIGGSDSATINIAVNAVNTQPSAVPTGGGTYLLLDDITLGGEVSDSDGDILSYTWYDDNFIYCSGSIGTHSGGNAVSLPGCIIPGVLAVGAHIISLEVTDAVNDPITVSIVVDVIDSAAPTLAPVANTNILWPPNHEMVDITITTNVSDNSGCFALDANVTSNEPENDQGDGDMSPDFTALVIDQENGIISLQLRAERAGLGDGRSYSVMIIATDCSGNTSTATVEIAVPHDRKKNY